MLKNTRNFIKQQQKRQNCFASYSAQHLKGIKESIGTRALFIMIVLGYKEHSSF